MKNYAIHYSDIDIVRVYLANGEIEEYSADTLSLGEFFNLLFTHNKIELVSCEGTVLETFNE